MSKPKWQEEVKKELLAEQIKSRFVVLSSILGERVHGVVEEAVIGVFTMKTTGAPPEDHPKFQDEALATSRFAIEDEAFESVPLSDAVLFYEFLCVFGAEHVRVSGLPEIVPPGGDTEDEDNLQ